MSAPRAVKIGRPFDTAKEAEPVVPPAEVQPKAPVTEVAPAPPGIVDAPELGVVWQDTPSIEGQAHKHPTTVRATGIVTEVFDLSDPVALKNYNELQGRATPKNPSIIVVKDQTQFAEKTGAWTVLFQYRKIQFRKLVPDKAENK